MRKRVLVFGLTLSLVFILGACESNKGDLNKSNPQGEVMQEDDEISGGETGETDDTDGTDGTDGTGDADDTLGLNENFKEVDVSAGGWDIKIEGTMRGPKLENVSVVLGYTDATTNKYVQEAPEGSEYFLMKLSVSKDKSKETIVWDNLTLTDNKGNVYYRCADSFIDDLGMKRMPGTDLNFGSNEGWIAFEIEEGAAGLTLQYEFENDMMNYTFD